MTAPLSLHQFARDMFAEDAVFAGRVAHFEGRHGAFDADGLAVTAQANYLCWFDAGFPDTLLGACRAIASGRSGTMTPCLLVSPKRWREVHQYVVATQRWLGDPRQAPRGLDGIAVSRIKALLGERTPARVTLAELYLSVLCEGLLHGATCGQLTGEDVAAGDACHDYSTWYVRSDGRLYGIRGEEAFVQERSAVVREELADRLPEAEELLAGILDGGRPACAARFPRYQDVHLASIGALRWRGNLPSDERPRGYWEGLYAEAAAWRRA